MSQLQPTPTHTGAMQSALVVSARFPGRNTTQAGHRICAMHIIEICSKYTTDLVVVCKENEDLSDLPFFEKICRSVLVRKISKWEGAINSLRNLRLPLTAGGRVSGSVERDIQDFAQGHYDLAHFEWTESAAFSDLVSAQTKHIMCHDILVELYQRRAERGGIGRPFWVRQTGLSHSFEKRKLRNFDKIFVLSRVDAHDLANYDIPIEKICVVAPEFYRTEPRPRATLTAPVKLLFWGSFARKENREAARFLIEEVFPRLPRGGYRAVLAGAGSDEFFESSEHVSVLGYVENVAEVFGQADIGVFPLFNGSGFKVKVLESMYAGLPVVTTSVGSEGFECVEENGLFGAQTSEQFVRQIESLVRGQHAYVHASRAAAAWARDYASRSIFSIL